MPVMPVQNNESKELVNGSSRIAGPSSWGRLATKC